MKGVFTLVGGQQWSQRRFVLGSILLNSILKKEVEGGENLLEVSQHSKNEE